MLGEQMDVLPFFFISVNKGYQVSYYHNSIGRINIDNVCFCKITDMLKLFVSLYLVWT